MKQRDLDAGIFYNQTEIEEEADAIYRANSDIGALSIISAEGNEVLTQGGNRAILEGLLNGQLQFGDAAITGFYMDEAMRDEIAAEWTQDLVQEGIELGLGYEAASYRARRLWYGDAGIPGIGDLIYSKDIPLSNVVRYNQLNTTYVIGPDGKPWATPFLRSNFLQALGIPLPHQAANIGLYPGTKMDAQGKVVDEVLGINTGLSGVVRENVQPDIKRNDELLDAVLDAVTKAGGTDSTGSGGRYSPYRYGSGGGYGGGGGGYFSPMRALPGGTGARTDGVPAINTSNPYTRRATVNRQRIWFERGRLKEWQ